MKKVVSCLLVALLLMSVVFTGCGNQNSGGNASTTTNVGSSTNQEPANTEQSEKLGSFLSEKPITLTYLISEHPSSPIFPDALVFKELEKRTNVKLDFQIVPADSYLDKMNVIIASGKIPDIMSVSSDQALLYGSKGLFAKLNSQIDESENLKSVIKPQEWLGLTAEDGSIYSIPYMIDTSKGLAAVLAYGWIVRKDWLNKLNMEEPKTLDEFYDMLVAFRDRIPALTGKKTVYPLVQRNGLGLTIYEVCNMFGTKRDYNLVDGKLVYTAITNEYKDMLMFVNKLYKENLLDKEFLTLNTSQWEAKMTSGDAGCTWDTCARADMLSSALSQADPIAELKIILPPKGPSGVGAYDVTDSTNYYTVGVAISSKSEYISESFKLFDYFFGSEGSDLMNFGIKDVTYIVQDGKYTFTDKIMEEIKTGLIPQSTLSRYGIGTWNMTYFFNVQADILDGNIGPRCADIASRLTPSDISYPVPAGKFTTEQMARLREIESTMTAIRDEYSAKFMVGQISFDKWEEYVAEMKKNNCEEYEKILNEGYQAYLSKLAALN